MSTAKNDKPMSAFKTLIYKMLATQGDFSQVPESIRKSCIKCYVKETYPKFLISDGSYFMSAYFTKESLSSFEDNAKKENSFSKISDLNEKVIVLTKWSLEFA